MTTLRSGLLCSLVASLTIAGCTSLQRDYGAGLPTAVPSAGGDTSPGPSPSGSQTAAPSACATQNPTATEVAMVSFITATPDPTYGTISGYAVVTNGTAPVVAQPIDVATGALVQFVNGETPGTPSINHSAVGFPNVSAFAPTPYAFNTTSAQPVGAQVGNAPWSTGRLAPGCYSTTFSVPAAGTYYFGDYDFYNLSNTRDVIVMTN